MERDLNFRKMFRMYFLNLWLVVIVGIIAAIGVVAFVRGTNETTITKSVYLIYDLDNTKEMNLEAKKNSYFDAYKALLGGNILKQKATFSEEEQNKLSNLSVEVVSSCYTITMQGENLSESDALIVDKYIAMSEEWMRDKYQDNSINAEIVQSNIEISSQSVILKAAIGFVIGAFLAVVGLFIWFVLDQKVRDEEDVFYYTGLNCLGIVKRR